MDILGDANANQEQKYKIILYPRVFLIYEKRTQKLAAIKIERKNVTTRLAFMIEKVNDRFACM